MKTDLFIVAAGKGSRMGGNIPKALIPITEDPCLTTTLQQIGNKFNKVFIVSNRQVHDYWQKYFNELDNKFPQLCYNIKNIEIDSGLGDGHAVMTALQHKDAKDAADDIVVCWGDVFFSNSEIIDQLLAYPQVTTGIIPVVKENNPYVTLLVDEHMNCKSADFSKYNELHPSGFHDQSVFRFNKKLILQSLVAVHSALWKNGQYIAQGGELSLLYAFHYLFNVGSPIKVYESDFCTMTFNTIEEVKKIQQEISEKWKNAQF